MLIHRRSAGGILYYLIYEL